MPWEQDDAWKEYAKQTDAVWYVWAGTGLSDAADTVDVNYVTVKGTGLFGLREPAGDLDCGYSGTTMRLLAGLLAGQPVRSTLVGDETLMRRPMGRVVTPLRARGGVRGWGWGHRPKDARVGCRVSQIRDTRRRVCEGHALTCRTEGHG